MKKVLVLLGLLFLGICVGCGGGSSAGGVAPPPPPPVTLKSIAIATTTPSIAPGTTAQFLATGTFSDSSTKDLTTQAAWSTSDATKATVSNTGGTNGLATGVAAGTATITATMSGVSGSASLTVTNASLVSVAVTPANPSINVGTQQPFTATGTFSDTTTQDITNLMTWTSANTNVAVVTTNSGVATGQNVGSSLITATAPASLGNKTGSTTLTVTLASLVSLSVTQANATPNLALGTKVQFTATGTFTDGSTRNLTNQVTWNSATPAVATIGAGGLATSVAVGTTDVTAAAAGITSPVLTLTVTNATLTRLDLAPSGSSIPVGAKQSFKAVGTFSDASTQVLTTQVAWSTSNVAVATISNSGVATALAAGSINILASPSFNNPGSVTGSVPFTVNTATLSSIAVTPPNALTAPAGTVQFVATGTYSDGSTQKITNAVNWTSSDTTVATIQPAGGLATGQGAGLATLTATQGSVSGSATLIVTSSRLVSITITTPNPSAKLAEATFSQFTATGTFADNSVQDLTDAAVWTSNAPAVATVGAGNGVVNAVAPGTAKISAAFAGVVGSLTLTVTNATLTSVSITPKNPTISAGGSQQFTATATFSDGSTEVLTNFVAWSSSNTNVAVIGTSGLATASGTGTTAIKAVASQNATSVNDITNLTVQ